MKKVLSVGSIMAIFVCLGAYLLVMFTYTPRMREQCKLGIYTLVFVALFIPDIEKITLPFDMKLNIHLYAVVVCGIELMERYTKYFIGRRIDKKKKVSKRLLKLYESL